MAQRTKPAQALHDRILVDLADALTSHDTYPNPNQHRDWSLTVDGRKVFPDLLLCKPGTLTVAHLIEVETEGSVTEDEAAQWALFARNPGAGQFWLLVPYSKLETARQICQRRQIAANFGYWWVEQDRTRFHWEKSGALVQS